MKHVIFNTLILIASMTSLPALASNSDQAADSKLANMVIYRPYDDSAINYRFSVDGEHRGRLKRNGVISLQLEQGDHVIAVNDAKHTKLAVTVNTQKVTYIHTNIDRRSRLSLTIAKPTEQLVAKISATNKVVYIN